MNKKVTVRVPATSANCGPGFDTLGLACTMYNEFIYEISDEWFGFFLDVEGEGSERLTPSGRNLAFGSFVAVWNDVMDNKRVGIKLKMINRLPLSRGLGSSSSAIVAGVTAANILSGNTLTKIELLNYANKIEGHPDNVAPALLGGFTISYVEDNKPYSLRIEPKKPLKFIAAVPNTPLSTALARKAIPAEVAHADAVFNSSRTALLVGALLTGEYEHLKFALEDRLHQPYRAHLIEGMEDVFKAAVDNGAYSAIISGAGSTLMAYADATADCEKIAQAMKEAFAKNNQQATVHILDLDLEGAKEI